MHALPYIPRDHINKFRDISMQHKTEKKDATALAAMEKVSYRFSYMSHFVNNVRFTLCVLWCSRKRDENRIRNVT